MTAVERSSPAPRGTADVGQDDHLYEKSRRQLPVTTTIQGGEPKKVPRWLGILKEQVENQRDHNRRS